MSNPDSDLQKQRRWHWVPLVGMAIGIVFVLFVALYEDDGGDVPIDQPTATNFAPPN
jgi:hypothetical protein